MTALASLAAILGHLNTAYCVLDAELRIVEQSANLAEWLSAPDSPAANLSLYELAPEFVGADEELAAVRAGELPALRLERINRTAADGSLRYLTLVASALPEAAAGLLLLVTNISEYGTTLQAITQHRNELQLVRRELERLTRDTLLMNELGELLLVCRSHAEVASIVVSSLQALLPYSTGVFYLPGADGQHAYPAASWGVLEQPVPLLFERCAALRAGAEVEGGLNAPYGCAASERCRPAYTLCVAVESTGMRSGLLQVSYRGPAPMRPLEAAEQKIVCSVVEQAALALASLTLHEELRRQALCDTLTGLYNRRYLAERGPAMLGEAQSQQQPLALLAIDIDHFKQVNDQHGHQTGDAVLQAIGRLLRDSVRSDDLVCRVGGEEFLLLLTGSNMPSALSRAEQIRRAAALLHTRQPDLPPITLSIGVASFPSQGHALDPLIAVADAALYQAKAGGRDRTIVAPLAAGASHYTH